MICCSELKGVRVALNIKSDNRTGEVNLTYAVIAFSMLIFASVVIVAVALIQL
ncbi:MAG: hypothetical protein SNH27_11835 [Rikenellaceae bacterium]